MSESHPSSTARLVVGVSGSPGSLTALARAADEARRRGTELWPVLAWEPPGGNIAARRSTAATILVEDWERLARERLLKSLYEVFGGTDTGLPGRSLIARGVPGPALVQLADRENDVIVIGAGRRGRLRRAMWPSVARHCLAHAGCPVLAVPPSPLQATLESAHRRNVLRLRLRLDTRHVEREFAVPPPRS